jgi:AcrR family transcriptional regulator
MRVRVLRWSEQEFTPGEDGIAAGVTSQRRRQTLEAAAAVIAERGLVGTRIADVAARARVSPALVVYYFSTKENLLTEALAFADDRFYLRVFHDLSALESARERLVHLIDLACPELGDPGDTSDDWVLWVELWPRALRDRAASKKREALDRRWRATIADVVEAGQASGEFSPHLDPDDVALRLAALMDGLALQVVMADSQVTRERMRALCVETAARELGFAPVGVEESGEPSRPVAVR